MKEQHMASNSELFAVDVMTADPSLQGRIRAGVAKEAAAGSIPPQADVTDTAWTYRYEIAAAPGWAAAWLSALAGNVPDPGSDNTVISDGQIGAQVVAVLGVTLP
jgi:hypothetical protein